MLSMPANQTLLSPDPEDPEFQHHVHGDGIAPGYLTGYHCQLVTTAKKILKRDTPKPLPIEKCPSTRATELPRRISH